MAGPTSRVSRVLMTGPLVPFADDDPEGVSGMHIGLRRVVGRGNDDLARSAIDQPDPFGQVRIDLQR